MTLGHFDPAWKQRVHALKNERQKAAAEKFKAEQQIFLNAVEHISSLEGGKIMFRAMMNMLDFKGPTCVRVDGVIDTQAMIWNEARRMFWAEFREFIPTALRNEIERDLDPDIANEL